MGLQKTVGESECTMFAEIEGGQKMGDGWVGQRD
jgi:hypothetical protein